MSRHTANETPQGQLGEEELLLAVCPHIDVWHQSDREMIHHSDVEMWPVFHGPRPLEKRMVRRPLVIDRLEIDLGTIKSFSHVEHGDKFNAVHTNAFGLVGSHDRGIMRVMI